MLWPLLYFNLRYRLYSLFLCGLGVSGPYLAVQVPSLMVHIYSENYRSDERGQKISGNLMISAVVASLTALLTGLLRQRTWLL